MLVKVHFIQKRKVHLDDQSEKYPDVTLDGQIHWSPALRKHPISTNSYFIEVEWRFRLIIPQSNTIILSFIYRFSYEIFFEKDKTTSEDLKFVINDSFEKFKEEYNEYKKDKNISDTFVTQYEKEPVDKWVNELIEIDLPQHNLI